MTPETGETDPARPAPRASRPFAAIALGFFALALPLFIAVAFSTSTTGAWTNAAAGTLFVLLGAALWRKRG